MKSFIISSIFLPLTYCDIGPLDHFWSSPLFRSPSSCCSVAVPLISKQKKKITWQIKRQSDKEKRAPSLMSTNHKGQCGFSFFRLVFLCLPKNLHQSQRTRGLGKMMSHEYIRYIHTLTFSTHLRAYKWPKITALTGSDYHSTAFSN